MKRVIIPIFGLMAMLLLASCEKWRVRDDREITLNPITSAPVVGTKAHLYENLDSLKKMPTNDEGGWYGYGGYFHVDAYYDKDGSASSATTSPFINSDVIYFTDGGDWRFYEPPAGNQMEGTFHQYYWPVNDDNYSIHFFAYAPRYKANNDQGHLYQKYVSVDNSVFPPSFSVTMPVNDADHKDLVEFMYAYTNEQKGDGEMVNLEFKHPFAAIYFTLKQAHRNLKIHTMWLRYVYTSGTYTKDNDGQWSVKYDEDGTGYDKGDNEGEMVFQVNKVIPNDINFTGLIGGPYLVLPQTTAGRVKFYVHYTWDQNNDEDTNDENEDVTSCIDITNVWQAGYKYTYNLDLGNSQEEILFYVDVTPWDKLYEYTIPIE